MGVSKRELPSPSPDEQIVAVAIDGKKKSKSIVQWALERFVAEGIMIFKLLHVRQRITTVPTPSKFHLPPANWCIIFLRSAVSIMF